MQGDIRRGQEMGLQHDGVALPVAGDDPGAQTRQKRDKAAQHDDIRHVEYGVRHGDVASQMLVLEDVARRGGIHEMEENGTSLACGVRTDDAEGGKQEHRADDIEQRMRQRRPPRIRRRVDRRQGRRDRRADVVAQDDRNGRPDIQKPRFGERDGYADRRRRTLHENRAERADRHGAENAPERQEAGRGRRTIEGAENLDEFRHFGDDLELAGHRHHTIE